MEENNEGMYKYNVMEINTQAFMKMSLEKGKKAG